MIKWIKAFRLRTLPLSLSGIIFSAIFSWNNENSSAILVTLAITTTLFLQILSNLANDYGDSQNGADNDSRVGPQRGVQSGEITSSAMMNMIIVFSVLSAISGLALLQFSFGLISVTTVVFVGVGSLAIWAAIKYTAGDNPYGYKGLGDVFVFIFFGLVAVLGSNFLFTKDFNFSLILPAIGIGALATAVLNLNNMRDMTPDKEAGKITIPVKLGFQKAKYYHTFLIISPFVVSILFTLFKPFSVLSTLHLVVLIPLLKHLRFVYNTKINRELDSELKLVALLTLAYAILLSLG